MLKKKDVLNQRYSRNGLNFISCSYRWTLGKVPSELTVQGFQVQGGVSTVCGVNVILKLPIATMASHRGGGVDAGAITQCFRLQNSELLTHVINK